MYQVETNEVFTSLQNMLLALELGQLTDYEKEKKHYDELKKRRKTQQEHPFGDCPASLSLIPQ